jgi:processive 1,2-diacylglycerol beta-glucosyltransferase
MRICLVYEGLFPATTRAARHVEAMARRFAAKGHRASVVTTPAPDHAPPPGVTVLRLAQAPARAAAKDQGLLVKTIARHLRADGVDLLFAEGLTPLSALATRAARACAVPTVVRVLSDRAGIAHHFDAGGRVGVRGLRKKISGLLEGADVVAASDTRCAELVAEVYPGPVHVIERCVDLGVFRAGRTPAPVRDALRAELGLGERQVLLYAREAVRDATPGEVLPVLAALVRRRPGVVFVVGGRLADPAAFAAEVEEAGLDEHVVAPGPLEGERLLAAYDVADLFWVPPGSLISAGEILEAQAMGTPVACWPGTVASAPGALSGEDGALVLPEDDPIGGARRLDACLGDAPGRARRIERALRVARGRGLELAIDQLEALCREVLGWSEETASPAGGASLVEREEMVADEDEPIEGRGDAEEREGAREKRAPEPPAEGSPEPQPPADEPQAAGEEPTRQDEATPRDEAAASPGPEAEADGEGEEAPRVETVQMLEHSTGGRGRNGRRSARGKRRGRGDVEELGASGGIDMLEPPARKGSAAPEPGLTLKELMPFLRPPRTLTIFGASTGGGHERAAAAIAEGLKGLDRNLIVRHFDLLDLLQKAHRPAETRALLDECAHDAHFFGRPFETQDDAGEPDEQAAEPLDRVFGGRLDELVVDKRPDFCVVTHWLPLAHLRRLKEQERLGARVVAVVCDPALHARWVDPVVTEYIVPEEEMRLQLQRRGVEAGSIHLAGYPVATAFASGVDRGRVLGEMGLDTGRPVVLLRPGGVGPTERVVALVKRLLEEAPACTLLTVVGKNERLQEELEALEVESESTLKVFGFVDNVRELMGAADLLVSRAAPPTLAEARAAGLPAILLRPAAGMEERAADRWLRAQIGVKAYDEEDLLDQLHEILTSRRRLRDLRDAVRSIRQPDGALQVVDRLARVVR